MSPSSGRWRGSLQFPPFKVSLSRWTKQLKSKQAFYFSPPPPDETRKVSGPLRPAAQGFHLRLWHQQDHPEVGDEQHHGRVKEEEEENQEEAANTTHPDHKFTLLIIIFIIITTVQSDSQLTSLLPPGYCLSLQLLGVFLFFLFVFFKATSRLHWLVKWNDVTPEQPPYWWMVGQPGWKQLCCCVAAHCKSGPKVNIESSSSSKPEIRGERKKKKRL